jgi:ABC-type spermidine/putrescine transport system permease subunit I
MSVMYLEETQWARRRFLALGLGVIGTLYLVAFILPMLYMVAVSFGETRLGTDQFEFEGPLAAYERFWGSEYYREIMFDSLRLAFSAIVGTIALGLPLAYTATKGSRWYRIVIIVAVVNPLFVSTIVRSFGLDLFLKAINLADSFGAVLIGTVQILLPFMVLPLMSGFRAVDPLTVHSAKTLGSGRFRIAVQIVLPTLAPSLLAGSVLVFILSMNIFSIPLILGRPEDPTMALVVYQSALAHANFTFAAGVALILLALALVVIFLQGRLVRGAVRGVV